MVTASIIFYILLVDSLVAVVFSYTGKTGWWYQMFTPIARQFPLVKGWTLAYLALVLFSGWILWGTDSLVYFW